LQHHSSSEIDRIDGRSVSYGRQIGQYDQDIACGQLKSGRYPSKNRTRSSRLRQRSANFSSLLERVH
ncbi:hypothetical protein, partial [Rhizobium leguminosarum]|uniref:hypothetical protein n=1 Tax=Rhizobium leguminosarum TaxID=384 RepID=UPI001AEBC6B2